MRLRLPTWTTHPGFGVLVLCVLAAGLALHGEPQPSSRPSGTSVVVSDTNAAPATLLPPVLLVADGKVERRDGAKVTAVRLPTGAVARSAVAGAGASVVLAARGGRQHAYLVTRALAVRDLGLADAVLPAAAGGSTAVLVESAVTAPGLLTEPTATATRSARPSGSRTASPSGSRSEPPGNQPPLRDYAVARYDATGQPVGARVDLPLGTRAAVDTAVGLIVWQPVNRVFDAGEALESLSASATLLRPDGSFREIGPVHPLAATADRLLVWDVPNRRFGVMPLGYVTATATSTASPSSDSPVRGTGTASASASASPSTVAGTRWFQPTRGFTITGPAAFNSDGSAFAVYALVGSRRRLVVSSVADLSSDQVAVLALAKPVPRPSPGTGSASPSAVPSRSVSSASASPSASSSVPAFAPDGFPISAPLAPLWWSTEVVAVGPDGTAVGYQPGDKATLLDLGPADITSIARAP